MWFYDNLSILNHIDSISGTAWTVFGVKINILYIFWDYFNLTKLKTYCLKCHVSVFQFRLERGLPAKYVHDLSNCCTSFIS